MKRETQKQREVRQKKGPRYNPEMVKRIKRAQAGQVEEIPDGDILKYLESGKGKQAPP